MEKAKTLFSETKQASHAFSRLASEEYTERAMPPVLKTGELLALFLLTVFFISNASTAAGGGVISYVYWAAGTLVFFLPSIIATDQLARMFPHEGSIYLWTYKAFGPFWAFFAGICWWLPGTIVVFNAASTCITFIAGLNSAWLVPPWQQGLAILGIIVFSHVVASRRTKVVQNLVNFGAIAIMISTVLIGLAGFVWLLSGHTSVTSFTHPADWQILPGNMSLFGLITISLLGVQAPLNMAGEIEGNESEKRKRIRRHLYWGALLALACYGISTFTLLVVEGPENGAAPFALVTSVSQVLGKLWGNVTVIGIMFSFIVTAIMYQVLFSRLLFVAGVDERLPRSFGRLSLSRVPTRAILLQTLVASSFTILIYLAIPYFVPFGKPANLSNEAFNVGAAVVTFIWGVASLFSFAPLLHLLLFSRDRHIFRQQSSLPVPVMCFICVIGLVGCLAAIIDVFFNSWIPSLIPNSFWQLVMGAFLFVILVGALIGSMFATSEVAFQQLKEDVEQKDVKRRV